ncbi:DEAD/DEAH box helicase [Pyrofollis japonicus]|uniref:DEAD/DEAH box helicase n=1 Tax=Pyrofollis japonicus TaxID=3060460 RepID=UPI00295B041E|nr:DEAD/DEAH box helicase [Pyrofollis japonicus]
MKFKICRWLERSEFQSIIRLATYLGRESGCSLFMITLDGNSYAKKIEEIIEFIERFGGELDTDSRLLIEKIQNELRKVIIRKDEKGYIIKSQSYLNDYLTYFRERGLVRYSRIKQGFIVKPYAIADIIERLELEGFKIIDETSLIRPNNIDIEFKGNLRDYQLEALEAWRNNKFRGVIVLPTGTGKTIIGVAAIASLKVPTLIVVYTREQLLEWMNKIATFTDNGKRLIGAFYSDEKEIKPITITTYQSAHRNIDILKDKFSLLIVDEAHHLPADKFKRIAEEVLSPYRLGLSATPYREDGRHEELFSLIGGIVYRRTLSELMEQGYVAPFEIIPVVVRPERDILAKYREIRKKFITLARGRSIEELVRAAAVGDNSARQAIQLMNQARKLLISSKAKLEKLKEIFEREYNAGSKILIFTQYVEQAEIIGKNLGIPVITSKTNKNIRNIIFNLFKNGRYRALVLTTLGDEGIDIPDANVGIVVSGTSSRRQFIQRLGRLLRPGKSKTARLYYIALKGTHEETTMRKVLSKVKEYLG